MKVIKQKSQQKWAVRSLILFWALLSGVIAFLFNPIKWANARNTWIYKIMDWDISTLTVCDPNNINKCLTIMDRNLWASKAWTWCSETDTWACGNHYQWWNNYGFEISCYTYWCLDDVTQNATHSTVDASGYWPWNRYSWWVFIYWVEDWSSPSNHNLRWWSGDSIENNRWFDTGINTAINVTERQWPCPDGYHVPSAWEWWQLIKLWAVNNNIVITSIYSWLPYIRQLDAWLAFQNDFLIPFAWVRSYGDASGAVSSIGFDASLWSSSPEWGYAGALNIARDHLEGYYNDRRTSAKSIRCFKDEPFSYPTTFQVIIRDEDRINQIFNWEILWWEKISESGTLMTILSEYSVPKYWYVFNGWFDSDLNIIWDLNRPIITQLDLQSTFVPMEHTVIFNTNWGTPAVINTIWHHESLIVEPNNPIKSWYTFAWWYIDEQLTEEFDFENTIITWDIVLYAKWDTCPEWYKSINNRCVASSAWVYYETWVIKITNWETIIYIKDRNQWAENSLLNTESFEAQQIINKLESEALNLPCQGTNEGCSTGDFLNLANAVTNQNFEDIDEADQYFEGLYDIAYNSDSNTTYWIFYFWWNNNWATYDELHVDWYNKWVIDELLYLRWFDNWRIWEDNTWWWEWEDDNPCDPSKWEYLPTMSDWKKALDVWWEIYGFEEEYEEWNNIPAIFFNDILVPNWYFSTYRWHHCQREVCYENNNRNLLALLFSSPVYAYEEKYIYLYDGIYLWWADSNSWVWLSGWSWNFNQSDANRLNEIAAPVRCFIKSYTVRFDTDWGSEIDDIEIVWNQPIQVPNQPTKPNYTFKWWYTDSAFTQEYDFSEPVTSEMVLYAKWEKIKTTWWTQLKRDNCPGGDYSNSYYDWDCGSNPKEENKQQHNSSEEVIYDTLVFNPHYSDEQNQAYQYAYHYWITTKAPISNANIDWNLTRIAMAKMLSQYAINVLWMKPDKNRNNQFKDVTDKLDWEYDDWVTLAYQLWIMWINMPNNEFRPNDLVPRAEFVTALSRLLYKTPDWMFEETPRYYIPHMEKLIYEWIISNPDPKMLELRWYVMLMLMRSDK